MSGILYLSIGYGLSATLVLGYSYVHGPGWLPHDECPHCCWCNSRVPLGDRIENRISEWIQEVRARDG